MNEGKTGAIKERLLNASDEASIALALDVVIKFADEAREELNAAVVQTISESQQDLGAPAAGNQPDGQARRLVHCAL